MGVSTMLQSSHVNEERERERGGGGGGERRGLIWEFQQCCNLVM